MVHSESPAILIVDDEPLVVKNRVACLRELQFEGERVALVCCYSTKEAEQMLQDNKRIGVILLDVCVENDIAGLDFAREVRTQAQNRNIQIVLLTAGQGEAPHLAMNKFPINDYYEKVQVIDPRVIRKIVLDRLARHALLSELAGAPQTGENATLADQIAAVKTQGEKKSLFRLQYEPERLPKVSFPEYRPSLGELIASTLEFIPRLGYPFDEAAAVNEDLSSIYLSVEQGLKSSVLKFSAEFNHHHPRRRLIMVELEKSAIAPLFDLCQQLEWEVPIPYWHLPVSEERSKPYLILQVSSK